MVLRASAGVDYWEFLQLLSLIAMSRLNSLREILTQESTLCDHFEPLRTLIQDTLSNSTKSVTFLRSVSEFETVQTGRDMELAFRVGEGGGVDSQEVEKLVEFLSQPLQELFHKDRDNVAKCEKTSFVLFLLYELCIVNNLLPGVVACVNRIKQTDFDHDGV